MSNRYINRNQGKDSTIEPAYFSSYTSMLNKNSGEMTEEIVRYSIEKTIENNETIYRLKQTINGVNTYAGDSIIFDPDLIIINEEGKTLKEALNEIDIAIAKTKTIANPATETLIIG